MSDNATIPIMVRVQPHVGEAIERAAQREALPRATYLRQLIIKALRESGDLARAEAAQ